MSGLSDSLKFWIQTLLIPLVLALVGYGINETLSKQQREFDKIKFTEQILNDVFDSDKPEKAIALTFLLPKLTEDTALSNQLVSIITSYYIKQLKNAAETGNDSAFNKISNAVNSFTGIDRALSDSIKSNPVTSKATTASVYEQKGISELQKGNITEARKNFENADSTFPGFHSSYEITQLLKEKEAEILNGKDTNTARNEALDEIRRDYSWKLNMKQIRPEK